MGLYAVMILLTAATCVLSDLSNGYIINQSDGIGYRLVYQAQPWIRAKEMCEEDGAKLAIPRTEEEFAFIQKLVRGMHYPNILGSKYQLLVWLGINNLEDYTQWKNIDGENIDDTGFHTWSGEYGALSYSDDPSEPHCAGMDGFNHGFRDHWCQRYQPYICQIQTGSQ